jgi:hypothetical protein
MTLKVDGANGLLQAYDYQVLTTGFSYTFAAGTQLLLAVPAGTLATGTVTMPSTPADGMNITIASTQSITALTINANTGQSIVGGATFISAGGSQTFVYRLANTTWYSQSNNALALPTSGAQVFASSGTFTVPDGITSIRITVYGGGGGGQSANTRTGGAGGFASGVYTVTSGTSYTVTVGAGGGGSSTTASSGQTTSFGSLISATGGTGGSAGADGTPGTGSNGTFNNGNILLSSGEFSGNVTRTGATGANLAAVAWSPTLKSPASTLAQQSAGARGGHWFVGCNTYYAGGVGGAVLVEW